MTKHTTGINKLGRKCLFLIMPLLESSDNPEGEIFKCVYLIKKHIPEVSTKDTLSFCSSISEFVIYAREHSYSKYMQTLYGNVIRIGKN